VSHTVPEDPGLPPLSITWSWSVSSASAPTHPCRSRSLSVIIITTHLALRPRPRPRPRPLSLPPRCHPFPIPVIGTGAEPSMMDVSGCRARTIFALKLLDFGAAGWMGGGDGNSLPIFPGTALPMQGTVSQRMARHT
jgi:hypothetical protein